MRKQLVSIAHTHITFQSCPVHSANPSILNIPRSTNLNPKKLPPNFNALSVLLKTIWRIKSVWLVIQISMEKADCRKDASIVGRKSLNIYFQNTPQIASSLNNSSKKKKNKEKLMRRYRKWERSKNYVIIVGSISLLVFLPNTQPTVSFQGKWLKKSKSPGN